MSVESPATRHDVTLSNVDIPFWRLVWIILKVTLASIPATIILLIILAVFGALFGGLITAITGHLGGVRI